MKVEDAVCSTGALGQSVDWMAISAEWKMRDERRNSVLVFE